MTEKRIFRTRSKCPKPLQDNLMRATMQDFRVVKAWKMPSHWKDVQAIPTCGRSPLAWDCEIVGSTGNIYRVCLDYCPTCTCPNFVKKQDICKHIFFVLLDVVGLPHDSPIAYQKSYLTQELRTILTYLQSGLKSSSVCQLTSPPGVQRAYKNRISSGTTEKCKECRKPLNRAEAIRCPSPHCSGVYHETCLIPDISRLTLGSSRKTVRTTICVCPRCDTVMDHDEGYINVADVSGQSRVRDTSTYRPCPGYPGYRSTKRYY